MNKPHFYCLNIKRLCGLSHGDSDHLWLVMLKKSSINSANEAKLAFLANRGLLLQLLPQTARCFMGCILDSHPFTKNERTSWVLRSACPKWQKSKTDLPSQIPAMTELSGAVAHRCWKMSSVTWNVTSKGWRPPWPKTKKEMHVWSTTVCYYYYFFFFPPFSLSKEMNPDNHYGSTRGNTLWDAQIHSAISPQFLILSSGTSVSRQI